MPRSKFSKTPRFLETECARRGYGIVRDDPRALWTISAPGRTSIETRRGRSTLVCEQPRELQVTDYDLGQLSRRALTRRLDRLR